MLGNRSTVGWFEQPAIGHSHFQNGMSNFDAVIKQARHAISAATSLRTSHVTLPDHTVNR